MNKYILPYKVNFLRHNMQTHSCNFLWSRHKFVGCFNNKR